MKKALLTLTFLALIGTLFTFGSCTDEQREKVIEEYEQAIQDGQWDGIPLEVPVLDKEGEH